MRLNRKISECYLYQVNAFVGEGYLGNPAGVCLFPTEFDTDYLREIAKKMDLSETAFLYYTDNKLYLSWFTRNGTEVDLCGHATLGMAHALWDKGYVNADKEISFHTRGGIIKAKLVDGLISLLFPSDKITELKGAEEVVSQLFKIKPIFVARTKFDYLIVVESEQEVLKLTPDFAALINIPTRGFIVTAKSRKPEIDYVARFFAPSYGVNEDPVTGSAHCSLAAYWSSVLNKNSFTGYQASPEGGLVKVAITANGIFLKGKAKEVCVSEIRKKEVLSGLPSLL